MALESSKSSRRTYLDFKLSSFTIPGANDIGNDLVHGAIFAARCNATGGQRGKGESASGRLLRPTRYEEMVDNLGR